MRRRMLLHVVAGAGVFSMSGCLGDGGAGDGADGDVDSSNDGNGVGADGDEDRANGDDDSEDGGEGSSDLSHLEAPDSYIMEQRFLEDGEGDGPSMIFEVHGDDMVFYEAGSKDESASYLVDGDLYTVSGDQCFLIEEETDESETDAPEYEPVETYNYESLGSETIDGVEMEVYRIEGLEDTRYYIDPATNYLRRIAYGDGEAVVDFHSFNEVDPIVPPDMECQNLAGE